MPPQGMEERDGYPVDTNCLFMTDGASPSVHRAIELLTRNSDDAFLTPIPQYPLCVFPHHNSRASAAPAHVVLPQARADQGAGLQAFIVLQILGGAGAARRAPGAVLPG